MKVKFINDLKDDIVSEKFSSIPQEKYVEFFNEKIIPLLEIPSEVTGLGIELVPETCSVRYYYYGKDFSDVIWIDMGHLTFTTRENELKARWAEFLKANLGIGVNKKLLALKIKAKLEEPDPEIAEHKFTIERLEQMLRVENAKLKKCEQIRQAEEERFKTDFADVLDENGNVIGL